MNSENNTKILIHNAVNVDVMYYVIELLFIGLLWDNSKKIVTYVDERKRFARWKKRALYFTWNTEGSSKLYNFL